MPDPRPLASLRLGGFDEPPARSDNLNLPPDASLLRPAMPQSREGAGDRRAARVAFPMPPSDGRRRVYVAPSTRRRRRSEDTVRAEDGSSNPDVSGPDEARPRRLKRRKLDDSAFTERLKPAIRYGWYGQVDTGRLQMELVSCDGGEHRDPRHPDTSLGPENVLKHDKSVYCSEAPSVNIVLRQADDRPFCLEKIHIVGPDYGFTAPVQEGLLYVAMTMKDLEKYIDPHPPPHARRRQRERTPELLSLSAALRDPEVNAALDQRQRHHSRDAPAQDPSSAELYPGNAFNFAEQHCEILASSDPNDPTFDSDDDNTPSRDRFITLLSDEEIGPEDSSPQDVLDYRLQRLRLARRRYEIERYDTDERWAGLSRMPLTPEQAAARDREDGTGSSWVRLNALMARSRVHDSSSPERDSGRIHHRVKYSGSGMKDGNTDVVSTPFSIRSDKNKVAIKLDPPVSGRFVLLKLWANKTNVDVQSVVLKGYGGCRFFPAISLK